MTLKSKRNTEIYLNDLLLKSKKTVAMFYKARGI